MLPIRLSSDGKKVLIEDMKKFSSPTCRFVTQMVTIVILSFVYAGTCFGVLPYENSYLFYLKFLWVAYPFAHIITTLLVMMLLKGHDDFSKEPAPCLYHYYATSLKLSIYDTYSIMGMFIGQLTSALLSCPSFMLAAALLNVDYVLALYIWLCTVLTGSAILLLIATINFICWYLDNDCAFSCIGKKGVEIVRKQKEETQV